MTCFAALLFMGFDMTISTYMSSYLELALDASAIAGLTITFYWTGSAAGRLVYPVLFAKYDTKKYLICVNLVTAVLLVLGLAVTKPAMMIVLIFLVGLLSGVNFPLEIGLACEQFPKSSVGATNASASSEVSEELSFRCWQGADGCLWICKPAASWRSYDACNSRVSDRNGCHE